MHCFRKRGLLMREIMHLEFITDRESRTHLHQDLEIIYILKGDVEILLDNKSYKLSENDFILINTNKKHWIKSGKNSVLGLRFLIDYQILTEYMKTNQLLFWCNTVTDNEESYTLLRKIMDQILSLYFDGAEADAFRIRSLMNEMLYLLTSNFLVRNEMKKAALLNNEEDARVIEIRNYILTNYQKQLSLNDLAEQMHLSSAHLSRYIKQNFGISFLEYLNNVRLFHAVDDLVYSNKKIINIAIDNGYPTPTAFNKAFRDCYQMTPSEYRSKANETNVDDGQMTRMTKEKQRELKKIIRQKKNYLKKESLQDHSLLVVDAEQIRPLKSVCNEILNVGDITNLMRSDVRSQIHFLQNKLNFKYIRMWNMLRQLVYKDDEEHIQLNFTQLDRILDFCLEIHLIPHIEIGYKPVILMERVEKQIYSEADTILFQTLEEYEDVLKRWFMHLINRYGLEEFETWRFEMRRDITHYPQKSDTFFECFPTAKKLLRELSPKIRLGGPGIILGYENYQYDNLFEKWKEIPEAEPDFISVYSFGYVTVEKDGKYYVKKSVDSQYTNHQVELLKEVLDRNGFSDQKIYVTEWNYSISNRNVLNDSCAMGAYVMQNLIQAENTVESMGWWHATDLLTEYHDTETALNGDNGMLTCDGIQKPVYYAFEFMNKLHTGMLGKNENLLITTNEKGRYTLVCHNSKRLCYHGRTVMENKIRIEDVDELFENTEPIRLKVQIHNVKPGIYRMKSSFINREHGSVQDLWTQMGKKKNLSRSESDYLNRITVPHIKITEIESTENILNFEIDLQPYEIRLIKLDYQYKSHK